MLCEDCNKKKATTIVFDKNLGQWFRVCDDCIDTNKDIVCPWWNKEWDDEE